MEKIGKKLKHDHTLTSILKFTIFAMVMLAPIFSVASRCLYVICNKNAKDSYSNKYVDKAITLTDSNKNDVYLQNTIWTYTDIGLNYGSQSAIYGFSNISLNLNELLETENINYVGFRFYTRQSGFIMFFDSSGYERRINNFRNYFTSFTYTVDLSIYGYLPNPTEYGRFTTITYTNVSLDNAFEYSLSQLQESSYYNWATNLGIYTPIHNMVSGLGGHDIIALLLAYWSIYTAIYIVFDIIIVCFVKITHLIQGE